MHQVLERSHFQHRLEVGEHLMDISLQYLHSNEVEVDGSNVCIDCQI